MTIMDESRPVANGLIYETQSLNAVSSPTGEGVVPAPLTPEQVQATIWPRDNPVANYLADEFCAMLESNIYLPMASSRKATILAAMQSWVANLRMAYDTEWIDSEDVECRADCLWIESLVDEAWLQEVER